MVLPKTATVKWGTNNNREITGDVVSYDPVTGKVLLEKNGERYLFTTYIYIKFVRGQ